MLYLCVEIPGANTCVCACLSGVAYRLPRQDGMDWVDVETTIMFDDDGNALGKHETDRLVKVSEQHTRTRLSGAGLKAARVVLTVCGPACGSGSLAFLLDAVPYPAGSGILSQRRLAT